MALSSFNFFTVNDIAEGEVLDTVERQLRDELSDARGLIPLSWLMIGQWARKPQADLGAV